MRFCESLTDVYCYAAEVPTTASDVFNNSPIGTATLHVPAPSVGLYQAASPWSGFGKIVGEETAVEKVLSSQPNDQTGRFYNLHGQRVENPTKGLYIVNGKKVMVK